MTFPADAPVIDTMIAFPQEGSAQYDFIRRQTKDTASKEEMEFPAEYMFKEVPKDLPTDDPISVTLREMDRHHIERGLIGVDDEVSRLALTKYPDRFVASGNIDPNTGMDGVRKMVREHEEFGTRAVGVFPAGAFPQVPINDKKMYPFYAKCVELDIPIFVCAGVPGPRLRMDPQRVELIDEVMYDFPELVLVTRHGCEPWTDLAVKLMLKWPGLHYSTSAFSPKYYPKAIIDFANTRGADKVLYGGYFPMGLSLERIFEAMPHVPFREHVWRKFLYGNAARLLKLDK
ncbi:amidohydrolase family protein [Actinocorallia sp. A-T 12471]|uniref:amidohydrolase family protein n=1 Tax=Actinocorallia sp. A-T 12471 TaxID=3089813 RepID=UPI0029D2177C|nr:amidohydrolase family protein [Actinocorallia sp. A-T 12471]MDX6740741.1 amidohydrolase family protein [Actinocorallia sp. A-T 12471]